jgi:hypothetical protein
VRIQRAQRRVLTESQGPPVLALSNATVATLHTVTVEPSEPDMVPPMGQHEIPVDAFNPEFVQHHGRISGPGRRRG